MSSKLDIEKKVCNRCGKPATQEAPDPYIEELFPEKDNPYDWWCDECYQERLWDIQMILIDMLCPYDDYEERKIKKAEKEKKDTTYIRRSLAHHLGRSKRYAGSGRQVRIRTDSEEETKEPEI